MAEPDNLVLEILRELRSDVREARAEIRALDEKVEGMDTRLTGLTHAVVAGFGALVHRLDDHETRIERLERDRA